MDEALRTAISSAHLNLPSGCRFEPANEDSLLAFEREFGSIPADFRWYLATCGGGVCGSEWIDPISELSESHKKFVAEFGPPRGWSMKDVFIIGWDGAGNPFGIEGSTGRILVEDHNAGGVHEMAGSLAALLSRNIPNSD